MDHCIVYFSTSVGLFDEAALTAILAESRHNNIKMGITGVMLYVRGSIIQVLEGSKQAVEVLFSRIENDDRHTDVVQVFNRPIQQRLFGSWSMGYETITTRQLEEVKSLVDVANVNPADTKADDHIILKTVRVFYNSNRYN